MNCPKCSAPVKDGVKFCNKCGSPLHSASAPPTTAGTDKPVCAKCGSQIDSGNAFCTVCGLAVSAAAVHEKPDAAQASAEPAPPPEPPKADSPDDTQPGKPEKAATRKLPQLPPFKTTKLWMPICAALVFVVGVVGIILLQSRTNIKSTPPHARQSDAGANVSASRSASGAESAQLDTSPGLPAPPREARPALSLELSSNYSTFSQNELLVATALYEHYQSYIAAINTADIGNVTGATPDYLEILRRYGIIGENSDYDFHFYEIRINMDSIDFIASPKSVSFDANCLFEYRSRGSNDAWKQGANVLSCQLVYDERSESWLVNSTFEQKEKEDQIFGVDTSNKNLLIVNDSNYDDICEHVFTTEYEINDVAPFLRDYYWNYIEAINEQDPSYLVFATPEQESRLVERIFDVNSDDIFTFNQIIIDLDTVDFYKSNGHTNVRFYAAFTFSYVGRTGSKRVNHGANIQHVNMVCDEAQREWTVDYSEIVQGVDLSYNQLIVK